MMDEKRREKKKALLAKLLEMAMNGTEHEKVEAAKKAQAIMSEWNLTAEDVRKQELDDIEIELKAYRLMDWQTYLFNSVATYAGCMMTFKNGAKKIDTPATIRFYGRERDIDNAVYISTFLFEEVKKLCQRYKLKIRKEDMAPSAKVANDRISSYRFGLMKSFFNKLDEQRREFFSENAGKGIIPLPTETRLLEAKEYMEEKLGDDLIIRESKSSNKSISLNDLYVGLEDGKSISLNKAVQ